MSALLDSLAQAGMPPSDASRRALLDAALRDGLPGPRSEAWKYTSLRALERRTFAMASAVDVDPGLLAGIPDPRMVFVNGRFDSGLSRLDGLEAGLALGPATAGETDDARRGQAHVGQAGDAPRDGDAVFRRLNAALARDGVALDVAPGARLKWPVNLVFVGAPSSGDEAWHLRNRLTLGAGASATIVEHQLASGSHAHLANAYCRVVLGDGAHLSHVRVQDDAPAATHVLATDAQLECDAAYARIDLELGSALARHDLGVRLAGAGARVASNGVLLADGRRHVDTRLGITHQATSTSCDLTWRGIGADRGRVVFHGGITIAEGADGSDASLSSKNLLLSDAAEIDTQPVLEIHADEVKAAHGATVGQLDPTALFYLRSRGLPDQDARRLLTTAFCREPLDLVEDAALRACIEARLDAALARHLAT